MLFDFQRTVKIYFCCLFSEPMLKYWHTCQQKNDMARENSLAWSNRSMQSTSCSDTRFPRGIGVVRKESEERT